MMVDVFSVMGGPVLRIVLRGRLVYNLSAL
jgi:hypothetical protein